MNSHNEPFQPENVEEQIQKLLKKRSYHQDGNSANAHLIYELQDLYDENAAILDHTWERISAELVDADKAMKNAPLHHAQTGRLGSAKQTKQTERRSLPLLLAGLVALLLIASMTMAFRVFMNRETASPSPTLSPLSNAIYINYTNTHSSEIIKRNPLTGVVAWRYPLPATATVLDQSIVGNTLYVMATNRNVYAINVATGTVLWIWSMPKEQPDEVIIPQKMVVSEKIVYVITDKNVYKLNIVNGTLTGTYLIGINPKLGNSGQSERVTDCLVDSTTLYAITTTMLYAYRLSDGTPLWEEPLSENMVAKLSSAQHTLYVVSFLPKPSYGDIKSSDNFIKIDYFTQFDTSNTTIHILAIDMNTGQKLWASEQDITFAFFTITSISVMNDLIYINILSQNGISVVYAFDKSSHHMLWNSKPSYGRVYIEAGLLFFDTSSQGSRSIMALNAEDGSTKWYFPIDGSIQTFTIQDGVIYATTSGTTYALNASNGSVLWKAVNTF